jgi:hypothetical protein
MIIPHAAKFSRNSEQVAHGLIWFMRLIWLINLMNLINLINQSMH